MQLGRFYAKISAKMYYSIILSQHVNSEVNIFLYVSL